MIRLDLRRDEDGRSHEAEQFSARRGATLSSGAMRRYDEALADLNRAIELDPSYRPKD